MTTHATSDETVERIVRELLTRGGKPGPVSDTTNLFAAGLNSQDGVEMACDLEARLDIKVPDDVNPLLHENAQRMRTLGELKTWAGAQDRVTTKKER